MDIEQDKQTISAVVGLGDIDLINKNTLSPLKPEDVFTYKVQICDNDVDRVGDKLSDHALEQIVEKIKGVAGLKDHDWSVENQVARLYDAHLVEDEENKTVLGEKRKYVQGSAYTLASNKEMIDKIKSGLLKEVSISFNSSNDRCSICGEPMVKDGNDVGHCKAGHIAGELYDGELCYNNIDNIDDVLEWSMVAVPCQRRAGINKKEYIDKGGKSIMKKAELLIRQFISSKSYEQADAEDKAAIDEAVKTDDNVELTDEDIKKILDENGKLKAQIKELEAKVKEAESGREKDKIEGIISKGLDEIHPLNEKVKSMMMKEIDWDDLKLEDGQIPGMADIFDRIKQDYKGLYVEDEVKEEDKGCGDVEKSAEDKPEVDAGVVTPEPEKKEVETPETKSKSLKPSGITFGVTSKSVSNTKAETRQPGIYFN